MAKKNVLIIEDEKDTAAIIRDSLNNKDYEITIASSAVEGMRRTKEILPDLITLDIKMPLVDGIEMLEELKNNEKTKDIPVIIITGVDQNYRKKCLEYGIEDYFQKPLDFKRLQNKINSILNKK
ncbi:MAG: response regulator [Elusimicrobiota bacterium]